MISSQKQFAQLSTDEKIKLLNQEFDRIDVNHDSVLSFQELCKALDQMNDGIQFDRDIAKQLYEEMDKNHDGSISRKEFINVYLKGESVLKEKIRQCNLVITDCQRQRKDVELKLAKATNKEKLNPYMVKEGSVCTVTIVELSDIQVQPGTEIALKIICGEDNYDVGHFKYRGNANINKTINVAITTGQEVIKLFVSAIVYGNTVDVGEANLPVSQLHDQATHNGVVDLQKPNGESAQGKLNLNLQWIHSTVKYLKDVLTKWDEHIQQINKDLQDYQHDIKTLYEPFRLLKGLKDMRMSEPKKIQAPAIENPFTKWQRRGHYVTLIMLTFAFLACFSRNTFLDILVGLLFMVFSSNKQFQETQGFLGLVVGVGVSILFDLLWLTIYSSGWGIEPTQERSFCLIMSYLLFLTKCLVFSVYSQVDKQYKLVTKNVRQSLLFDTVGGRNASTAPNTNEIPQFCVQIIK